MANDSEEQSGEKTEDPSAQRIEEFRKRGEVASSKELTSVIVLASCILTLALSLVYVYETIGVFSEWLFSLDPRTIYSPEQFKIIVSKSFFTMGKCVAPVFIVSFCVSILANIMQVGFLYAPDVLNLKLERINPINGIKKLFSMRSLVEAFKGLFKFMFIISIVYLFLKDDLSRYRGFYNIDAINSFLIGKEMLIKLSLLIVAALFVIALGDFAYQKMSYQKKLRQTKEEAKKELKEREGNPEIKQRIKAIQREMSHKRMMSDVPKADVIVTNPTHISIALQYDAENMISPIVLAKGADHVAFKIREVAKENNIPLVENVTLARSIFKTVKIGDAVPRSLYKAVAEVLAFVYKLKNKVGA